MAVSADRSEQERMELLVGHPSDKADQLHQRIQTEVIREFAAVETDFLDLAWTMDAYRVAEVLPRGVVIKRNPGQTLAGYYRTKGNMFSTAITLVLDNKTQSRLASRSKVKGFSQDHQIDIAWPAEKGTLTEPQVCCEAKLTGAPAYDDTAERSAYADWTNRRKEMKFAAADLKLARKVARESIDHWDVWRANASPLVFAVWGARLSKKDKVEKMIREASDVTRSYLDGLGIYAFRENDAHTGYVPAALSRGVDARVTSLDDVLDRIAAHIKRHIVAG